MVLSLEHMPQDKLYRIGNDVLLLDELMVADTYPSHFRTEATNILLLSAGSVKGRVEYATYGGDRSCDGVHLS